MMDFTTNDLLLRNRLAERKREMKRIVLASRLRAEPRPEHRGLRAVLASKLARLALRIDRETASSLVAREFRIAGRS